jgi:predicted nucleic acid-binding protein
MAWVFEDEANSDADVLAQRLRENDSVVVPAVLWALEVANTLRTAVLKKRITQEKAEERRKAFSELPIVTVPCPHGLSDSLNTLMRAHQLTSYDAAYLAVALEQSLPLATNDEPLRKAALKAGVSLWT